MALHEQSLPEKNPRFSLHLDPAPDEAEDEDGSPFVETGRGSISASTISNDESFLARNQSSYVLSPQSSISTAVDRRESVGFLLPNPEFEKRVQSAGPEDASSWRLLRQLARVIWNDWWIVELGACLIAALAMAALAGLLYHCKNQPLPHWPLHIKISTMIAICSNITSAMVLLPVAESISQYKWYWYRQRRSLDTMELFDGASRGVAGSVLLLLSKRRWSFVSVGAVITILALGIEPCFQEVVQTPLRNFNTTALPKPVIGMVRQYTSPWPIELGELNSTLYHGEYILEKPLKAGVYEGLFGEPNSMTAACLTGNCTWNTTQSLGVCNQCQDVSRSIRSNHHSLLPGQHARLFLDNGLQLVNTSYLVNSSTSIQLSEIGYTPWTLLNMSIMSADAAYECSVFWCVNEYNSSMTNGTLWEEKVQTWSNDNLTYDRKSSIENMTPACNYEASLGNDLGLNLSLVNGDCINGMGCCFINVYTNSTRDKSDTFRVDYMTHFTLRSFLEECLGGNISLPMETSPIYSPDEMQALATLSRPFPSNGDLVTMEQAVANLTLVNVPDLMDNITDSISARLRQAMGPYDTDNAWTGTVSQSVPMVEVHFLWLLYPVCLLLVAFAFLLASIKMNTNTKIWKSSTTAMLFSGLAEKHRIKAATHDRLSELDDLAEELGVMLDKTEEGWRLT